MTPVWIIAICQIILSIVTIVLLIAVIALVLTTRKGIKTVEKRVNQAADAVESSVKKAHRFFEGLAVVKGGKSLMKHIAKSSSKHAKASSKKNREEKANFDKL